MGNLKTISFKTLINGLPVFLILTILGGLSWSTAIILTFIITAVAYLVGDYYILPSAGNWIATLADGGLALLLLWGAKYTGVVLDIRTIIYSVIAVVIVEGLVYHPYLKRLVSADSIGPGIGKRD